MLFTRLVPRLAKDVYRWFPLLLALLLVGCASSQATDLADEIADELSTEPDQSPFPPELAERNIAVDPSTARELGEHAGQRFWQAENEAGEICLIDYVEIQGVWMSALGCASEEDFARHGVFITSTSTVIGAEHFAASIALPDGYAEDAAQKLPTAVVMPNLIVFDAPEAIEAAIDQHGDTVMLTDSSPEAKPDLEVNLAALRGGAPAASADTPSAQATNSTLHLRAEATRIAPHSGSPDGQWLAYWQFTREEVQADPMQADGSLHFLNTHTLETCEHPSPVAYGHFNPSFAWLATGDVLIRTLDGQLLISSPCAQRATDLSHLVPAPVVEIAAYNPARVQFLVTGSHDYWLLDVQTEQVLPLALAVPPSWRSSYAWSPAGQRLAVFASVEDTSPWRVVTYIAEVSTGTVEAEVAWHAREGLGSLAAGVWLDEERLLIPETLDQGPLLVEAGQSVVHVSTEFFGIQPAPNQQAHVRTISDGENVRFLLRTQDFESPSVLLYDTAHNEVQTLPGADHGIAWSPDGEWLVSVDPFGDGEHGPGVWLQGTDPAHPVDARQLSAAPSHILAWRADSSRLALAHAQTITVISVPEMLEQTFTLPPTHTAGNLDWSPDGAWLWILSTQAGDEPMQSLSLLSVDAE